jgi:hypothetical protein
MQTDVDVADGAITGTLKYLSTGSLVTTWGAGNFMALKFTSDYAPENIRVGLDPSVSSGLVPLDEDMNGVFKVTDKDAQVFVVESFDGAVWSRVTYDLSGLTLETS